MIAHRSTALGDDTDRVPIASARRVAQGRPARRSCYDAAAGGSMRALLLSAVLVVLGALALGVWLPAGPALAPGDGRAVAPDARRVPPPLDSPGRGSDESATAVRSAVPGRNPFQFGSAPLAPDVEPAPSLEPDAAMAGTAAPDVERPAPVLLQLIGIAEDVEDGAVRRTAVIAGLDDTHLVRAGDLLTSRFRVVAVDASAVQVEDLATGRTLRLALP